MYEKVIKEMVRERARTLGVVPKDIMISRLGMGENNLNFLVITGGKKFVFRIGLRSRLESNMAREFKGLQMLPEGVGPKPLFIDRSKRTIPHVFSVLTYIEGKKADHWTKRHLSLHAKKLALLHKKTFPYASDLRRKSPKINLYRKFKRHVLDVSDVLHDPSVLHDPEVKSLLPKMSQYIKENATLVDSVTRFSVIHADLGIDNIIFLGDDVHYIDWEWMRISDPAIDLARFYYEDFGFLPWTIQLSGKRFDFFISEYERYSHDKTVRHRVSIWNTYFLFTDMLYNKWKIRHYHGEQTGLSRARYGIAVRLAMDSLKKRF